MVAWTYLEPSTCLKQNKIKQVCGQPRTSAVNVTLLASAAKRRAAATLLLSAPAASTRRSPLSTDMPCPPGARQQTHRPAVLLYFYFNDYFKKSVTIMLECLSCIKLANYTKWTRSRYSAYRGEASLIWFVNVFWSLQLHLKSFHANLKSIHRLYSRVSTWRIVKTHKTCRLCHKQFTSSLKWT